MTKSGQRGETLPKTAQCCPKWRSVAQSGVVWPKVVQCGPKWRNFEQGEPRLGQNVLEFI